MAQHQQLSRNANWNHYEIETLKSVCMRRKRVDIDYGAPLLVIDMGNSPIIPEMNIQPTICQQSQPG